MCVNDLEISSGVFPGPDERTVREEAENWAKEKEKPKNDEQTRLQVCRSEPPICSSRQRLLTVDSSNGAVAPVRTPAAPTGRGVASIAIACFNPM